MNQPELRVREYAPCSGKKRSVFQRRQWARELALCGATIAALGM
jgi:hypothetical protein